jgi:hypothetical protein
MSHVGTRSIVTKNTAKALCPTPVGDRSGPGSSAHAQPNAKPRIKATVLRRTASPAPAEEASSSGVDDRQTLGAADLALLNSLVGPGKAFRVITDRQDVLVAERRR